MNQRLKKVIIMLSLIVITFIASFYKFNDMYFLLCVPILVGMITYKGSYFFLGFIGMFFASFFLDSLNFHLVVILSCLISYALMLILNHFKVPPKYSVAIVSSFFGFFISLLQYDILKSSESMNLIIMPILSYVLGYNIMEIAIDLKSKEKFSITKKELVFVGFLFNLALVNLKIFNINFQFGIVFILILNYIFMQLEPITGIVGILSSMVLSLDNTNIVNVIIHVLPIVVSLKCIADYKYFKGLVCLFVGVILCGFLEDFSLVDEIIVASSIIVFIPYRMISILEKYIIEPQDYELKLYQESYYKCLNRNKKIQKVLNILEDYLKTNTKIKKHSKEILLGNMKFLSDKLKEEENIKYKEEIYNHLKFKYKNILGLKITRDYLNNYKIKFELSGEKADIDYIKEVLESKLDVKLKGKLINYNYALDSYKYVFKNEEKIRFSLTIKQRSKDGVYCGDSYLNFNVKNKKYYLISDGMGHGKDASKNSSLALFLLKQFIELGMGVEDAINSCNALILNKENEKFNTLDLLEYDIYNNEINLYKNGSGVTYLKNGNKVDKVSSENLPLGIIENIKINKQKIDTGYDYIVLTSDGFKKDLTTLIGASNARNTKTLTNQILEYEGNVIEDDQTIVVLNVIKNK